MTNRLQVGIDFSQKRADLCLLTPTGEVIEPHVSVANSPQGAQQATALWLATMADYDFDGLAVSGEATGYYWLPFFLALADDEQLAHQDLDLYLLNPRWVKWFKKCFAPDDKTDQKDPFYIAERTRTRPPAVAWQPQKETLPLRFYSRYRFHLAQDLSREKAYFAALLFLKISAYYRIKPFANIFGTTSRLILSDQVPLSELAQLSAAELTDLLAQLSHNHLPDPAKNAHKLQRVVQESFSLDPALAQPVQLVLNFTLDHIHFLETQMQAVEAHIETELHYHPNIQQLATIPGLGLIFSAGIGTEIGDTQRFLSGRKWDKGQKRLRPRTLRDAEDAVAKIAGLWWPKNSSGEFEAEERRLARTGNRYLRYYLILAADQMRQRIPEYATYYSRKFQEVTKHQHKRALVLTARKGLGLFVGLLHRNEAYRPQEVP